MSTFETPIVKFKLERIKDSDHLSLAHIRGWQCVVRFEEFAGDNFGVYIPLDAVADKDHPLLGFMKGKKVKTIKLRGVISQGILLPLSQVRDYARKHKGISSSEMIMWEEGKDLHEVLEVKKWEPPVKPAKLQAGGGYPYATVEKPSWLEKYTDIENWNNWPDVIKVGEQVTITEKIHGTSAIFALIDNRFYLCSRNRCLRIGDIMVKKPRFKNKKLNNFLETIKLGWLFGKRVIIPPENTVWHQAYKQFDMEAVLLELSELTGMDNVAIYGEIVGVQDLMYGMNKGNIDFYAYDIKAGPTPGYTTPSEFGELIKSLKLKRCPVLYIGEFSEDLLDLRQGESTVPGASHVREGIVIEPNKTRWDTELGRVILKKINEDYLLRQKGTDY